MNGEPVVCTCDVQLVLVADSAQRQAARACTRLTPLVEGVQVVAADAIHQKVHAGTRSARLDVLNGVIVANGWVTDLALVDCSLKGELSVTDIFSVLQLQML